MKFKEWLQIESDTFRFDPNGNIKPELLKKISIVRQDPRFEEYGDDQIEMMLMHHTPEEVLKFGPEVSLERYQDLSMGDAFGFDWK